MNAEFVREGGCHCGNIRYSFQTTVPVAELPLRACACSFCTRHGARYTSDPGGKLMIDIAEDGVLSRYRFATQTAEFLVCTRCGVMSAVLARIDGRQRYLASLRFTRKTISPGLGCSSEGRDSASSTDSASRKGFQVLPSSLTQRL